MRSKSLFCASILLRAVVLAVDPLTYPATLEVDIVFPRNDTYLAASPFPVIIAIQNAGAFLEFNSTRFSWTVDCKNHSLATRSGEFTHERMTPPTEPWFIFNVSKQPDPDDYTSSIPVWKGAQDICVLKWTVDYWETCTLDHGLSETWGVNAPVEKLSGNLTFSLAPDSGVKHMDQLLSYPDCPVYGNSMQVASKQHTSNNGTVCPDIDRAQSQPPSNPCAVKFAYFSQSVLAQLPTPTATFTPTSTSRSGAGRGMGIGVAITGLAKASGFALLLGVCGIAGALVLL